MLWSKGLVECPSCEGDGYGPSWRQMNCATCGGRGAVPNRYCEMCEVWMKARVCKACGADTVKANL
jgi:DnaJ-class molecular chaperone